MNNEEGTTPQTTEGEVECDCDNELQEHNVEGDWIVTYCHNCGRNKGRVNWRDIMKQFRQIAEKGIIGIR